jgi:hypothetical protein
MSPEEMREHLATAGNPASREIKSPLAVAGTVAAVAMRIAVAEVEMAEVARIAVGKSANEDFRC